MSRLDELDAPAPPTAPGRTPPKPRDHDAPDLVELVIRPRSGWIGIDWGELVRCRELLFFLAWRDVKVRYKQTVLGVAWALLQPLLTMAIFTVIFGRVAGFRPPVGVPYPVFVFAGLLPWTFFANGLSQSAQSLVAQQQMLTKVYFPRLFIPTAVVGVFLIDLAISSVLFGFVMLAYKVVPSWQVIFLPLLMALTVLATLGLGYLLSALTVFYRDFRYTVPFLVQILMYVSPVIYPASLVGRYRYLLALNPMFGIIDGWRSAILGTGWDPAVLSLSAASATTLFVLGLFSFRKMERRFADIA